MTITHEDLSEVVATCYNTTPQIYDEFIAFMVDFDPHAMEVVLSLITSTPSKNPERQSLHVHIWFCHKNGERFNLAQMPHEHLLKICSVMQDEIDWGTLCLHKNEEGEVEIGLYRCFDITPKDLALAANGDHESELIRTFDRLAMEFSDLMDTFAPIAEQKITTLAGAELLIGEPAGHA